VGALPFTRTVRCTVRAAGYLLSYRRFANGAFELAGDAERATLMTTMLTDVATVLWERCLELDRIDVQRKLRRPWLVLLPGYAELAESYVVTLHVRAATAEIERALVAAVDSIGASRPRRRRSRSQLARASGSSLHRASAWATRACCSSRSFPRDPGTRPEVVLWE
jgi:hypothetical protein